MEDDEQDCRFLASAYSSAKEGNSTLGWCKQEAATPNAILHGKSSVTSQVRKPQKAVTLKVTIQHLKKKRTTLLFLPHYHNFKQSAGVGYSGGSHFENLLAYKVRRKSLVFLLVIHSLSEHPLVAFSRLDHIKLCQILQKFQ